ncbi:MAG: hypothetical protein GX256_00920 [Fretibacterium sp.]|nr:hypothetical protein [Fretibacterium sp.]
MGSRSFLRNLAVAFLIAFLCLPGAAAGAERMKLTVTSPWLFLLSGFIGGANVTVVSMQEWNANGDLVRVPRSRAPALTPDDRIMAFDEEDARKLGVTKEKYPQLSALYDPFPIHGVKLDEALADPSVLPFVAQRVLTVLADWDPAGYPYYQRRLAEFQARLYSTILAGRQLLKGQKVYDLTGSSRPLLQAAGCEILSPSEADLEAWSAYKGLNALMEQTARNGEQKIPVVIDFETPKAIRRALVSRTEVFLLGRPPATQDYPSFLHDQYTSLWLKVISKPLVPPGRKR